MIVTIEIPDALAHRAAAAGLAPEDVSRFALAGIAAALTAVEDRASDAVVIAAGQEAIDDVTAGRLLTLDEVDQAIDGALASCRAEREAA